VIGSEVGEEVYISLVGLLGTHLHCIFKMGFQKGMLDLI